MRDMEKHAAEGRSLVICVDDEVSILSSLERLLKREPYVLRTTRKTMDVLDWLREEEVCLVISDQKMPEMMGTDLLERVHQSSPTTARILLTGYPGCSLLIKSTLLGIQAMFDKPWDDEALKRTIRAILTQRAAKVGPRSDKEDAT
jgi:DNA-binding NtrC family response regulator